MPIKHAALKQLRKDRRRRQRNQAIRSELKTLSKQFAELLKKRKLDDAQALLRRLAGRFDRAATKGVVHRNTASRAKSRLTARLARTGKS
ncbi:MAG TPA: 30S ribosomal protein S20 [bacterium]